MAVVAMELVEVVETFLEGGANFVWIAMKKERNLILSDECRDALESSSQLAPRGDDVLISFPPSLWNL